MNEASEKYSGPASRPVVFGEVLFDDFEGGPTVIGGAAFNLAWNLESLGLAPLLISRIGADELGGRVLQIMTSYGMDTAGIQFDEELPTGTVSVRVSEGQPDFTINDHQAYDAIDAAEGCAAMSGFDVSLLYHGSLALRGERSRGALEELAAACGDKIFVDVNLRRPWWQKDSVLGDLSRARWAKINEEELSALFEVGDTSEEGLLKAADDFRRELGVELLLLTCGAAGAAMIREGRETIFQSAVPVDEVADTVGAGDAITAVTMLGLTRGWGGAKTLGRAVEFAASICRLEGATTHRREHYDGYLESWEQADLPGLLRD